MVDMTPIAEGQYLTVEIVSNSKSKKVVVLSEGEIVEKESQDGEKYTQLMLDVEIDKKIKKAKLNAVSCRQLMDFYKITDTKYLVGKVLDVSVKTKGANSYLVFEGTDSEVKEVVPKVKSETSKPVTTIDNV